MNTHETYISDTSSEQLGKSVTDTLDRVLQQAHEADADEEDILRAFERGQAVWGVIDDFADTRINDLPKDIALLHGFIECATEVDENGHAKNLGILREIYRHADNPNGVAALVDDYRRIDEFNELSRQLYFEVNNRPKRLPDHPFPLVHPQEVLNLFRESGQDLNRVSLLIKAAAALAEIESDETPITPEQAYTIESFYAPYCDVLGFQGLGMALYEPVFAERVKRMGEKCDKTSDEIEAIAEQNMGWLADVPDFEGMIEHIVDDLHFAHVTYDQIGNSASRGVRITDGIGTMRSERLGRTFDVRTIGRAKMRNAWLLKYLIRDQPPRDIIGLTHIVADLDESKVVFGDIVAAAQLDEFSHTTPNIQPGKPAFRVYGNQEMIGSIMDDLAIHTRSAAVSGDPFEIQYKESEFECLKAMLSYTYTYEADGETRSVTFPLEIQVQTEAARKEARFGKPAHGFRKAKMDVDEATELALKQLGDSRKKIKDKDATPGSLRRGAAERNQVLASKKTLAQHVLSKLRG